jgi:peptidyl-prolyl cis-trans isomerase A (cyclophilin A)
MRPFLFAALSFVLLCSGSLSARPASGAGPGLVRVRLETSEGLIIVALDTRRAPKTTANFLSYVDDGRLDGTTFYRAARRKSDPRFGFIQGGIDTDWRRALPPVELEPTSRTGLTHLDATISMARSDRPNSAMGNFFMTVGATPNMDAAGAYQGYAAFGRVVGGMDAVRRILAKPTGGGRGPMRGQKLFDPVILRKAVRLDGKAKPTGGPRPWLLQIRPPAKNPQ